MWNFITNNRNLGYYNYNIWSCGMHINIYKQLKYLFIFVILRKIMA